MYKQRYEYYKGSTAIIDNETDEYVEDVVDVLNQKDFNINELLKTKQLQAKQIADLETKLAESEKIIRLLKMSNDALREDNLDLSYNQVDNVYETATEMSKGWESQYQEEIAQLKQQLAEKEKEIISYEHELENYEHELEVYKHNDDIYANSIRSFANKNKQEKNQTAIAELEKVKEKINAYKKEQCLLFVEWDVIEKAVEFIDQQIAELKGESR